MVFKVCKISLWWQVIKSLVNLFCLNFFRDLKLENILLADGNVPKLSDFGFAVKRDEKEPLHNTHCCSYVYAAPEVLKQQKYDGKRADVWSLGVILFGMIQGYLPYKATTAKEALEAQNKTIYMRPNVSVGQSYFAFVCFYKEVF